MEIVNSDPGESRSISMEPTYSGDADHNGDNEENTSENPVGNKKDCADSNQY